MLEEGNAVLLNPIYFAFFIPKMCQLYNIHQWNHIRTVYITSAQTKNGDKNCGKRLKSRTKGPKNCFNFVWGKKCSQNWQPKYFSLELIMSFPPDIGKTEMSIHHNMSDLPNHFYVINIPKYMYHIFLIKSCTLIVVLRLIICKILDILYKFIISFVRFQLSQNDLLNIQDI